jgi:response regulator RpfG family c-di-GMP phosphodiesterase
MSKRLLLVEDDEHFRAAMKNFLQSKHFVVTEAADGNIALANFAPDKFDLILSDIRMPNLAGTDLLLQIRKQSPVPFILMTGFSDIMEVAQAHNLGASGFVTKPFKPQELLLMIENSLQPKTVDHVPGPGEKIFDFCPVNIEDFLGSPNLKMDIYVRLTDDKFVKIAHKGTLVSADHIKLYKSKGITVLYIRADEFGEYVNFNSQLTDQMAKKSDVPRAVKVKILKHAQEILVKNVFLEGLDREKIENSSAIIRSTLTVLGSDGHIFELLENINDMTDHVYAHSMGVSVYSVLIAQGMGWHSAPVLFKLSLGGLLHEIGTKEISREILDKPRHELTAQQVAELETHTFRGKEILSNISAVPGDVVQIVLQHHENCYGKGPLKLKAAAIHPLAKVVALADRFAELAIKNPVHPLLAPIQAIDKIISDGADEFDPTCMASLKKLFSHQAAKRTA